MKRIIISLTFLLYIINTSVAQYNDPKWEFGAEAGFAWVGFPGQGIGFLVTTKTTKRKNREGFRAAVMAKYNLNRRVQIIGGVGFIKAKGEIDKNKTTEGLLFGGTECIKQKIMQEYNLIEIPTYVRFCPFYEHESASRGFNIFFDLGTSLKIPVKTDLSFSKIESYRPNYSGELEVKSFFGSYTSIGFSVNNKITIAFTSSLMRSQAVEYNFIKYWSRLKSISLTFFL